MEASKTTGPQSAQTRNDRFAEFFPDGPYKIIEHQPLDDYKYVRMMLAFALVNATLTATGVCAVLFYSLSAFSPLVTTMILFTFTVYMIVVTTYVAVYADLLARRLMLDMFISGHNLAVNLANRLNQAYARHQVSDDDLDFEVTVTLRRFTADQEEVEELIKNGTNSLTFVNLIRHMRAHGATNRKMRELKMLIFDQGGTNE